MFKAPDVDSPSGCLLLDGVEVLSKPITEICNSSISHGVFPDACKAAKLKLMYLKEKKSDPSYCKPISLLPIISKVIWPKMCIFLRE